MSPYAPLKSKSDEPAPNPRAKPDSTLAPLLAIGRIQFQILRDFPLPTVAVIQQPLLVVVELLAGLHGVFAVRPLDDGVHRAGLLAQAAVDAFDHVDVVAGRAARAVGAGFGLDDDGLGRTDGLAQLAGDAALFPVGIAAQGVLAAAARR